MSGEKKFGLKITQASLNQTALDRPRNMRNIYAAIDKAVENGSDILALEELAITGYEVNDDFQRVGNEEMLECLDNIAAYAKVRAPNLIISVGHPWRLQMRDVPTLEGEGHERPKNPLYDRLNLPFNVQSVIANGEVAAMTAKANLYNDGRGYEKRYFNEWSLQAANDLGGAFGTIPVDLDGTGARVIPFGRPVLRVTDGQRSFNLTQAICEEKWVSTQYDGQPHTDERYEDENIIPATARHIGSRDGLVLLIANASPPARDKVDRHVHLDQLAGEHAEIVIDTDGLGSSGSTFFQFGHKITVQDGEMVAYGPRLSFKRLSESNATVEVTNAPEHTADKAHATIAHAFNNATVPAVPELAFETDPAQAWDRADNPERHYEEVVRYTAAWLFDYMRKSGSRGIMEALSGGADSAYNSVMVSVMVNMGIKELGAEKFCAELRLPFAQEIVAAEATGGAEAAANACLLHMLTGVYMGTNNSSDATFSAAKFLMKGGTDPVTGEHVKGIGGKFLSRNVQDLLDFYAVIYAVEDTTQLSLQEKSELMSDMAGFMNMSPHISTDEERAEAAEKLRAKYPYINDLVCAADGLPYENIQARGRQVLIMLFANKEGKMAVANPNLDEARNAYATFGGDQHSGTINLNAHLPKGYELEVMEYLYKNGVQGVMDPIRSLGPVLRNKPSAELLPKDADGNVVQHDEDALQRSFDQMNFISEAMLYAKTMTAHGERRLNATEVYELCEKTEMFQNVSENTLYNMVRLSYQRWNVAQHKIHAAPIGPTFGSNVDHQTSQRTPNLSGQSKYELADLGVKLMQRWAHNDDLEWDANEMAIIERRAKEDERFVDRFGLHVASQKTNLNFDLRALYDRVHGEGWEQPFPPLPANDPINLIHAYRMAG